ncbi:MAG TPA: prephenate dehydrogenase/arogenate dehydrogenase family protein [Candidatus Limnocylindrales bacterium]|nr:prephenate dehydrogenase/arogenate dehydrogenase family protein [Candidatus Limnocylindrales bacterium]
MRIALLGLGLIGGSIARALRERSRTSPADHISAWTPSGDGPAAAARDGVIDVAAASPDDAIAGADLIVLAGPAPVCLAQLDDLAGAWRGALAPGVVITDVASTKTAIVLRATALGLRFVGGHPMAGRETSGYGASSADLFVDRPWVIVPSADEAAVDRVEALATATGARPLRMTAAVHDEAVAAISHLPLVVAAALVETVAGGSSADREHWAIATALASSGWRDMTRLARGDVAMGTGIVSTNAPAIALRIRDLIGVLEAWLAELERPGGPNEAEVAERLRAARERLEAMA